VVADRGRVAVERGPLAYCAEGVDHPSFDIFHFLLPRQPHFAVSDCQIQASSNQSFAVKAIEIDGQTVITDHSGRVIVDEARLTLIPYFAWNHRGPGRMQVWLPQSIAALGNY